MRGNRVRSGSGNTVGSPRPLTDTATRSNERDPCQAVLLADGRTVAIRAMTPSDVPKLFEAYRRLSEASRRQRFLSTISEYTAGRLDAGNDENRYVLVAAFIDEPDGRIIATAQFVPSRHDQTVAEPAIAVTDEYQGLGLGRLLWDALIEAARQRGVRLLSGILQDSNVAMRRILMRARARISHVAPGVLRADVVLSDGGVARRLPANSEDQRN
jgi:GNAT superfamily N-acetyltransferase